MDTITITPRLIYLEDLAVTMEPAGATASVNVLGAAGNPQTLHKIAVVLYTAFTEADTDIAAAAAGVAIGEVYLSSASKLRVRLS